MDRQGTLYSLQYLRAVAAILVVIRHAYQMIYQHGTGVIGRSFEIGAAGVDIFFVISGFIMCYITQQRVGAGDFFRNRWVRVAPSYWLITLVAASLILALPSAFNSSRVTASMLVTSLTFIAWPHPTMDGAMPVYLIGWTLNYEFAFYATMSLCIALNWHRRVWLATSILFAMVVLGAALSPSGQIAAFYTNSILLEFVFGMAIWKLWRSFAPPTWLSLLCIVLGVAGFVIAAQFIPVGRTSWFRFLAWGIPAALTVYGTLGLEKLIPRVKSLRFVGDASYAIYLIHFLWLGGLRLVWKTVPGLHDAIILLASVGGSIAAGGIFYLYVEKPLVSAARALLSPRTGRREAKADS